MIKQTLLYLLTGTFAFNVSAQKQSKWAVEARTYIYTDDYSPFYYNWPQMFAEGYAPVVDESTLTFGSQGKGGGMPSFKDGSGVRIDIVRRMFPIAKSANNRVDWSLGVGYRKYKANESFIPYNGGMSDTTMVYQLNILARQYTQRYVDLQTRAVYKLMNEDSKFGFYLGLALQMSLAYSGKIQEDYTAKEMRWNTAGRNWIENAKSDEHKNVPAKKINHFSIGVPAGFIIKLADHVSLLPEFTYMHNYNRQYYRKDGTPENKSTSASGYLTIGLRYDF